MIHPLILFSCHPFNYKHSWLFHSSVESVIPSDSTWFDYIDNTSPAIFTGHSFALIKVDVFNLLLYFYILFYLQWCRCIMFGYMLSHVFEEKKQHIDWKSVFSYHVNPGDRSQVIRHGSRCLHMLNHLTTH